jgi:hypothetical protein
MFMPARIAALPRDKGRPVPWFVQWFDGTPDFRVVDGSKFRDALRFGWCWVCGERVGRFATFTVGPMCVVNRTSAEPPAHRECAEYSARACPFLSIPNMVRRERHVPDGVTEPAGIMIKRNPGVTVVWTTLKYTLQRTPSGPLFDIGEPVEVEWFAQGRQATRAEIMASIESGLPALQVLADTDEERQDLDRRIAVTLSLIPVD